MNTASSPTFTRAARFALALLAIAAAIALTAQSAFAINVNLRVEGTAGTIYNGTVNTAAGATLPGGPNSAYCHSDGNPTAPFAVANTFTALADAKPALTVTTSGGYATGFGVQLCSVNGEDTPASGGWLVKINEKNVTAPAGYVTASDELKEGDSALVYRVTTFDSSDPAYITGSLELNLPATAAPGQAVTAQAALFADADDSRSTPSGVTISGGGASATTDSNGVATLAFPSSGTFLVTATKAHAVRGSAWITVDPAKPATPIVVKKTPNRFVKCAKTYPHKSSKSYRRCIRIVRAKQAAEKQKQK